MIKLDILIENATKRLRQHLSPKRMAHSLGVSMTSYELALQYGADPAKARIAGLLHDCARELSSKTLLQLAADFGILVTDVDKANPSLLHAPVGAYVASREYSIRDEDILQAIYWHTTGKAGMTLLEKIIFIADYIEPGRHFPGVDTLRKLANHDLDQAVLTGYDLTLRHIIDQGGLIHTASVEGRNFMLLNVHTKDNKN